MGFLIASLKNTNAKVRTQAVSVSTAVYSQIKNEVDPYIKDLPAALKQTLTAAFRNVEEHPETDLSMEAEASPALAATKENDDVCPLSRSQLCFLFKQKPLKKKFFA